MNKVCSCSISRDSCRVNFHDPLSRRDSASLDASDHNLVRGRAESGRGDHDEDQRPPFHVSLGAGGWLATAEGGTAKLWEFDGQRREFRLDAR